MSAVNSVKLAEPAGSAEPTGRVEHAGRLAALLTAKPRSRPVYRWLADGIRTLVLDGRLPPGTRLPGERDLAMAVEVSRTTVTSAYARLRETGFVTGGRRGAASQTTLPRHGTAAAQGVLAPRPLTPSGSGSDGIDLTCATVPAPPQIAHAMERAASALPAYIHGHGYFPSGLPVLRALVAAQYAERGLPTDPDQIIVTGGAQAALAITLRALTGPGDRVAVEHPTYPNTLHAIRTAGARPVPVPVDRDGLDQAMLAATLRQAAPKLACLVPDFHNPTGWLMPESDREQLARTLARTRTLALIDETLAELALDVADDDLPTSLGAYDRHGGILLAGSLGKTYWGGLGIGWIRAPAALVPKLLSARFDLGVSVIAQLTAVELLAERPAIVAERRAQLTIRRDALLAALAAHLPDWRYAVPQGGLSVWCELGAPVSTALTITARTHGVLLAPGPSFGLDGAFERFLRLPYTLPADQLAAAVRRIAATYAAVVDGAAAVHTPATFPVL